MRTSVVSAVHIHTGDKFHVMTLIDGQYCEVLYSDWVDVIAYIRLLEILGKKYTICVR